MLRRTFVFAILAGLLALVSASPAAAVPAVTGEFDVPGLGNNNKLVQGPDGNMWVTTGGGGKDVARITPAGQVEEFAIEAVTPSGITVGPEGRLWVARNGGLVSFLPSNPTGTKQVFNITEIGNQPSVVRGPDGNLWVVGEGKESVVRVPPGNPVAGATPFPVAGLQGPKDIDAAGQLIVIAAFQHIFAVNTAGAIVGDQKILNFSQGVAGNPNGQYAYSQPTEEPREFGVITPGAAPIVTLVPGKDPFGVALGSDGAYWAPEFNSDGLLRITPAGVVTGLPGFAKSSAPRQIAAGPNNTLWVTLEMTKKVGRVSGLEPPVVPPPPPPPPTLKPKTRLDKGPKGVIKTTRKQVSVSFKFSSPEAGAGFECRITRLVKKGAKKAASSKAPVFKACKSPQKLELGPGRYRFEVRAVLAGIADESPAKRSFRIVHLAKKSRHLPR
jgi:virginiamycin B lyase